jgi:serine/threonine protein kinase
MSAASAGASVATALASAKPGRKLRPEAVIVEREIGHGAFGTVYLVRDPDSGKSYACKTEKLGVDVPQLDYERRVYHALYGTAGVPRVYYWWVYDDKNWLAMEVLGPSLEKVVAKLTQWDVVNWVCPQALSIIERVHACDFLHRDIKPENLLTGISGIKSRQVYLVDYGLCKRFRMDAKDHIPYREGKRLTGTVRYASVRTHIGEEQSRRDDLESLGYVLVYLIRRKLPWMGLGGKDKADQHSRVMKLKIDTTPEQLCEGLPPAFVHYFRHVRSLEFDQSPNYALLRSFFSGGAK